MARRKKAKTTPRQKGIVRKKNGKVAWGAGRKLNNLRKAEKKMAQAKKGTKNLKLSKKKKKK